MKVSLKDNREENYITHIILHGERVIPSDSFEIGENEYLLLEIMESTEGEYYLKIMGIAGPHIGNRYLVPQKEFETRSLEKFAQVLLDYQL